MIEVTTACEMVEDLAKCTNLVFLQNIIINDDATGNWKKNGGIIDPEIHKYVVNKFADSSH